MTEPRTHWMTRITCWRLKPKSTRNWFLVLSKNVVGPESKPRSVTSNCASLTKRFVPKKRRKRRETGENRLPTFRKVVSYCFCCFLSCWPQACFLALIVWHWQQAACSDTHRSNESPTSEVFTTHQWMRIDFENCLRITLQKFPVHHQRTSIKFDII